MTNSTPCAIIQSERTKEMTKMEESWIAWTVLFILVVAGIGKFIQRASDEWNERNYDESHFTGYEDPRWRK
ncbi:MAG: hypothetical protein IKB70_08310 [Bacilli bacterium]|nr:hypothetical protein [Bacilli bacterium]